MTTTKPTFVIVGASLAGAKAAETLRSEGFDGRILLLGDEPVRPYERPPMSKEYLRGEKGFEAAAVHDAGFYASKGIELRTSTTVTAIDPVASTVQLASGESIVYERLLLATGAAPRRLLVPGADLAGVLYLRNVADADALRHAITAGGPVVVVGAGWVGTEVAASARQMGCDVALVETASVPLERVLGPEVGAVYRVFHAGHGVQLHFGVGVESLRGTASVEEVRLSDGTALPAATVVVGIGAVPRTELAQAAGLALGNGVLADEHLASSAPHIYVAGDLADAFHPLYGVHVHLEHWSAALNQGPAAAKGMMGTPTVYDKTPYFYSDQYDLGMEYRGWAPSFDQVVFRGDPASGVFLAFWLESGRVLAAMNANIWDAGEALEALVRERPEVDPARLGDPDVELSALGGFGAAAG